MFHDGRLRPDVGKTSEILSLMPAHNQSFCFQNWCGVIRHTAMFHATSLSKLAHKYCKYGIVKLKVLLQKID
nr:hypothetical protein TR92_13945 [Brucella anthropi]